MIVWYVTLKRILYDNVLRHLKFTLAFSFFAKKEAILTGKPAGYEYLSLKYCTENK